MVSPHASNILSRFDIVGLPIDYHLFQLMQTYAYGHILLQLRRNPKIDEWIALKNSAFYRCGIALLPERWKRIIENRGNYFD